MLVLANGAWASDGGSIILGGGGGGGGGSGDVVGPASSTNDNIAAFDGTTGKLIKDGGITATAVSGHVASTSNPHATDIGNIGSGTLAELNLAITDATLDDSSAARTPTAHASSHEDGGSDEIEISNLPTTETDTALVLKPDGLGGVAWGSAGGGGNVEDLSTASTDALALLHPDGVGGLYWMSGAFSRVTGTSGQGSTNTNILRFTTEVQTVGSGVGYTQSTTLGDYWAVPGTGIYSVTAMINMGNTIGPIYINVANSLSNTLDAAHVRAALDVVNATGTQVGSISWTGLVSTGERIWISCGTAPAASSTLNVVSVSRLA